MLSRARAQLTSTTGPTDYIDADARDTATILAETARTLDFTHPARDQVAVAVRAETSLTKSTDQKPTFRTRDEVPEFAAGLDLVEPGVVPVQEWHPDSMLDLNSPPTAMWGCVARKS